MTKKRMQMAVLSKVIFAYQLLEETEKENDRKQLPMDQYIVLDVKLISYRMLIVNYLTVLIGKRKNDKISIKTEWENPEISNFYKENASKLNH